MKLSERIIAEITSIRKEARLLNLYDKKVLLKNLVFCYHIINKSEDLISYAASKSKGRLKAYFKRHLIEETNHAKWLKEDLMSAGIDVDQTEPHSLAVRIVSDQFRFIDKNPANLLGYMAVLEGFPTPMEQLNFLEQLHGKEVFRTVRLHAVEDVKHSMELWEIIDKVNKPLILDNAIRSAYDYNEMSDCLGE
jgi:hypothetical protein